MDPLQEEPETSDTLLVVGERERLLVYVIKLGRSLKTGHIKQIKLVIDQVHGGEETRSKYGKERDKVYISVWEGGNLVRKVVGQAGRPKWFFERIWKYLKAEP